MKNSTPTGLTGPSGLPSGSARGRWGVARVRGVSMLPTVRSGDRLLVRYGAAVRPGDLVLARLLDGTIAVKRAVERRTTATGEAGWWLLSDNADQGVDSRHRGVVRDADVLARVVLRLWRTPTRQKPG
ncbi:MAG: S24/S26 family peptidase [Nocardioides sp.]